MANGEFDANFFQHNAYLKQFNQDKGLDNVGLFYVYSAPGGIWSDKYKSLDELPDGAKIGIPVDPANNGRALFMLRDAGPAGALRRNSDPHVAGEHHRQPEEAAVR